jgi:hypothetical protein
MSGLSSIYLFGDQAAFSLDDLQALVVLDHDYLLAESLEKAASGLRQEIQLLPAHLGNEFPAFVKSIDLLAVPGSQCLHPALRLALSTTYHIAVWFL